MKDEEVKRPRVDKRPLGNIILAARSLWPYLIIFLCTFSYYYFFTERLPWFGSDDIQQLDLAGQTTLSSLLKEVFTFNVVDFATQSGRPVLRIFVKCCDLFLDEVPHYYRLVKLALFILTLCALFYLLVKHNVDKFVALLCLSSFAIFPQVMIVNAWVNEAATLELFFKTISFVLFFLLLKDEDSLSIKSVALGLFLIIVVIFADKSKVTAKIIPFIFLSYLVLTRNKKPFIYFLAITALVAIFPFGVLNATHAPSSSYIRTGFAAKLFSIFIVQMSPLLIFTTIIVVAGWKRITFKDKFILFLVLWLAGEMAFYFIYPFPEMRYLFSSLCAATLLMAVLLSESLTGMKNKVLKQVFILGFVFVVLLQFVFSTNWNYNFRGTCFYILYDNSMKYINHNYKNSLCLYVSSNVDFYSRKTNNKYVNIDPKFNSQEVLNIVRLDPVYYRIILLSFNGYENILTIGLPFSDLYRDQDKAIDYKIKGSLFDSFQDMARFKIRRISFYNTSFGESADGYLMLYKAHRG